MPFDFNTNPLRLFGTWPQTPIPLDVSIYGYCQMACNFCFANRNRDIAERELNPKNSVPALLRKLDRVMANECDALGWMLREKYPVCFSNTTDPFQREETTHRASETFLAWAKANGIPVLIQTRGNVLFEEFERYAPLIEPGRCVVYVSICQDDDSARRRQEPGALSIPERWELCRMLSDRGVPVVAGLNPYLKEWTPDPEAYLRRCTDAGVRGLWFNQLHLSSGQAEHLPKGYDDLQRKANLLPSLYEPSVDRWAKATAAAGLHFYPTAQHWCRLGCVGPPEACESEWLGGKTLDFAFRVYRALGNLAVSHKGPAAVGWPEWQAALETCGVPNPELDVDTFWVPFNSKQVADRRSWKARLGKRSTLHEVIRYFWNHPFESTNLWFDPRVRAAWFPDTNEYATDDQGDLVGVLDPESRPCDPFTLNHNDVGWGRVAWPDFRLPTKRKGKR